MHLADAFIQSDLQYIQVIHFFCQYMCSLGIEPTTFVLITQYSTTEPQEMFQRIITLQEMFRIVITFFNVKNFSENGSVMLLL